MSHEWLIYVSVKLNTYFLYEVKELFVFTMLKDMLNQITEQQQESQWHSICSA